MFSTVTGVMVLTSYPSTTFNPFKLQFISYSSYDLTKRKFKVILITQNRQLRPALTGLPQTVGERPAATQAAIQTPWAALHARIAAGTAAPPVETPAVPPAAATQATHTALHPV